jgi:SAM-dependent methyltransferase
MTEYWEQRYALSGLYSKNHSKMCVSVNKLLSKAKRILVLGGGYGRNAQYFAKRRKNARITSIDIAERAISEGIANFEHLSNLHFEKKDLLSLDYKMKNFDSVIALYTLNSFLPQDVQKILTEVNLLLDDNGLFVGNFLRTDDEDTKWGEEVGENEYRYDGGLLMKFYTKTEVTALLTNAGFQVDLVDPFEEERKVRTPEGWHNAKSKSWFFVARKR